MGEGTPCGHWHTLTVLGAIRASGWVATMTIEAPTVGEVFLAYREQVLCPQLRAGVVVVMDNLAAHKVEGMRELLTARGVQLLYSLPYSRISTFEKCWAKIKQLLRGAKVRSLPALERAVAETLAAVLPAISKPVSVIAAMPYETMKMV